MLLNSTMNQLWFNRATETVVSDVGVWSLDDWWKPASGLLRVSLGGFDTHVSNLEGHRTQLEILDPAFATLLQDLSDRDLLESTVVLCIGEFGRTPQLNPAAGRDHWPHWFSCVVAGGGFRAGHVAGA